MIVLVADILLQTEQLRINPTFACEERKTKLWQFLWNQLKENLRNNRYIRNRVIIENDASTNFKIGEINYVFKVLGKHFHLRKYWRY